MPEVKFLGMCITENFSWQAHICSLCHSLSKTFFIIKSVAMCHVPCAIAMCHVTWNIYFTYFYSRFGYGIILWGGGDKSKHKAIVYSKKGDQINL